MALEYRLLAVALLLFTALSASDAPSQTVNPEGLISAGHRWPKGESIFVCWQGASPGTYIQERAWVQTAITGTLVGSWSFVGWGECSSSKTHHITITIIDESKPQGRYDSRSLVGRQPGGAPTQMWMNFTYQKWSNGTVCDTDAELCVKVIAVHEFMHALGVLHEQNRDDVPEHCLDSRVANDANPSDARPVGSFCARSITNYCTLDANGQMQFTMYERNWSRTSRRVNLADCDSETLRALSN